MSNLFAPRMGGVHRSFLTEILRVTETPGVISLAGGLPNSRHFPVVELAKAAAKVLDEDGETALQYTSTQGYPPLRAWIADRYRARHGLVVDPADLVITNGSQQAFDLIGKLFLSKDDRVIVERPGYHGAIIAFSLYEARFASVPVRDNGVDTGALRAALNAEPAKLFYAVPNFQNPSGLTYTAERRAEVAALLAGRETVLVEDDPYGELRFEGEDLPPIKSQLGDQGILLGTFSKIVVPAFRLGWAWARRDIVEKLIVTKQAADFHSDYFAQRVIHRYLADNDLDAHIAVLRAAYKHQCEVMLSAIERHIPEQVSYTRPQGGMFIYLTLPRSVSALELFDLAARQNVVFVPSRAFQCDRGEDNACRLSYSSSTDEEIEEGVRRLGEAIRTLLARAYKEG